MPLHGLSDLSSDTESKTQDYQAPPAKTVPHTAEPVVQFGMSGGSRFLKSTKRVSSVADPGEDKFIPQRGSKSVPLSKVMLIEDRIRKGTNSKLGTDTDADRKSSLSAHFSSELNAADRSHFFNKKASATKGQEESEKPHAEIHMASASLASHIQKDISIDSDEEDMRRLLGKSFESPDRVLRQTETSPQQAVKVIFLLHTSL